jgi:acyl-CoA synthetase (NDP forming)
MKIFVEKEAEDFLEKNKFPVAKRVFIKKENEIEGAIKKLGYPLSMKVVGQNILHKTDVGGVKLDIRTLNEAKKNFKILKKIKGNSGVLIQKFIEGKYVLVGLKKTSEFGHVLVFGLGGVFTEIISDVSFRVCPVNEKDVSEMIEEIKGKQILYGVRGGKRVNLKAIKQLLLKTCRLSSKYPNLKELDINPAVVNEKEAIIVDARAVFE